MQETAPFVSRLVRHRPQRSSSTPPNKSFICILKLIHNLKQEERDFYTNQTTKTRAPDFPLSSSLRFDIYQKWERFFDLADVCMQRKMRRWFIPIESTKRGLWASHTETMGRLFADSWGPGRTVPIRSLRRPLAPVPRTQTPFSLHPFILYCADAPQRRGTVS